MRYLLDTHVLVRFLLEPRRLSREHRRILSEAARRQEPVALSAITLLEIASLLSTRMAKFNASVDDLLGDIRDSAMFQVLPITFEIASDFAAVDSLRDPADRTIVATARVHGLRLLTSDQRIIDSALVLTIQ